MFKFFANLVYYGTIAVALILGAFLGLLYGAILFKHLISQ